LNEYPGGRGMVLIRDNILTPFSNLTRVIPSATATLSYMNMASFTDNQFRDVTIWLRGFLEPGKSSRYEFTLNTNGDAILYLSTDSTSSNKIIISSNQVSGNSNIKGTRYLEKDKLYIYEFCISGFKKKII